MSLQLRRRKTPKTLSGIETPVKPSGQAKTYAGKHLKPYQGLKLPSSAIAYFMIFAGKHLKPYQGLKHRIDS